MVVSVLIRSPKVYPESRVLLYRVLERLAVIPHLLWLRLVEVCIFCLCVLSPLQVAAVYKDPSVGNLINIVIVKLIVVHNEPVSAALAFHSPGPCRCLWPGPCSGRTVPALSVSTLRRGAHGKTSDTIVRQLATCK